MSDQDIAAVEKLKNQENYPLWKWQIEIIFGAGGLLEYVNGGKIKPELNDKNESEVHKWVKEDSKAKKAIMSTIDKSLLIHLLSKNTSKEMYDTLKTLFERDDSTIKCNLMSQFYKFEYDNSKTVADNIAVLQNIGFKLKSLEENISDNMIISKVLLSLPEKFRNFDLAWESTAVIDKTLSNLIARLSTEELKNATKEDNITGGIVFKVFHKNQNSRYQNSNNNIKCYNCGKFGHVAKFCRSNERKRYEITENVGTSNVYKQFGRQTQDSNEDRSVKCNFCKKNNHKESSCYI